MGPDDELRDRLLATELRYRRLIDDLAAAERRYRELVEQIPAVVYLAEHDATATLRYVSPQIEELLGESPAAFLSDPDLFDRRVHPDDLARLRQHERETFEGDAPFDLEYRMIAADGRVVWVWDRDRLITDDDGVVLYKQGVLVDVTAQRQAEEERRRAEEQIAYLAYHDPLTGLPNRALLREHLELALARARRNGTAVAVLYLDLDDFKLVNDTLGHAAGDELLRNVARDLRARTRASDLLARQGGDEFLVLLSDVPVTAAQAAAQSLAESLGAALAEPYTIAGAEFHVGGSIGISLFPRDAGDAEGLLKHADAAMYRAKAAGRGEVHVYSGGPYETIERLSLPTRLRRAISGDQLELHWQPIVDLADGSILALEALVRWRDPERGLLLPGDFVPFAEETGLIDRLGQWVAEAVGAQRAAWTAQGLRPSVHLNISPHQLRRPGVGTALAALVGDPTGVTVEITESVALREDGSGRPLVRELRDAGLRVAIDDFGAGWSSLSRLRELPVHVVKIDQSFLAGVPTVPESAAIVTAILALVDALGLEAVAEGVERPAQRAFLADRGCVAAQGFLLGRPVPAADLEERLRESGPCSTRI